MKAKTLNRIIDFLREEMAMTTGSTAGAPGFSNAADPKGPVAGYDKPMKIDGRRKFVKKYINDLMKKREKREEKKRMKTALNFNPYFAPQDGRRKGSSS